MGLKTLFKDIAMPALFFFTGANLQSWNTATDVGINLDPAMRQALSSGYLNKKDLGRLCKEIDEQVEKAFKKYADGEKPDFTVICTMDKRKNNQKPHGGMTSVAVAEYAP